MKTRFNKFMSLLVSLIMLISMITMVNVSAADKGIVDGFYADFSGKVEVSAAKAYHGSNSLHIDTTAGGGVWLGDPVEDFGVSTSNTYFMEFYMYPVNWATAADAMWVSLSNRTSGNNETTRNRAYLVPVVSDGKVTGYKDSSSGWTVTPITEGEKAGWYKVRNNVAITPTASNQYMFVTEAAMELYIDNICLYVNGEQTPSKVQSFEPKIDYAARVDYMPKNFMAVQSGATQMNISWRNPAAPAISSVKLYNTTDAKAVTEIVPETAFDTTADAINSHYIDGITSGTTYTYRLDITFADGTFKSFVTGCEAGSSKYSYKSGTYTLKGSHNTTGNPGVRMTLDDNTYATSAPSIHVVSNDSAFEGGSTYSVLELEPVTALVPGKSYQYSLKIKHNNSQYIFTRGVGYKDTKKYMADASFVYKDGTKTSLADWTTYSNVIEASNETTAALRFVFGGSSEDFWIDDFELYEYDTEANTRVGENILIKNTSVNVGSADDASARPAEVTNVEAEPAAFGAKLSWTAGEDAEYIAVYDKDMSEYNPVAYVPASLGSVTLSSLADGEEYNYIVKTVNAEGRESEKGVEIQTVAGGEELIQTYYVPAKNFIVTQVSATQISVSWRNPKATDGAISTITKAEVYDAETNEHIYTGTDMTANAISEYLDTDFTAGTAKSYRLDLTYSNGAVKSQVAGIVPASAGYQVQAGSWKFHSSQTPKPAASFEIDDKVYKTAAPSIRVASNKAVFGSGALLELIVPTINLINGKTYRVLAWTKKNNTGYIWTNALGGSGKTNQMYPTTDKQYNTSVWTADWEQIKQDFTMTSDMDVTTAIKFDFQWHSEDVWIDDIELYEVVDGNITGDNLLGNAGGINDVAAAPAELSDVQAVAKENEVMIRWGVTNASYVAVYDVAASEDIPVAYVPAAMGYVDLKNMTAGKQYSFVVKAVNAEGRESANGVAASATPLATALVIGDYETAVSGNEVTVSVDMKNNSYGAGLTAQLFLAVYDGKVLEAIEASEITAIPQTDLGEDAIPVAAKITVPEGKTMIMYLWNSLDGMKPLKARQQYLAE